jgi:hypothetical protein
MPIAQAEFDPRDVSGDAPSGREVVRAPAGIHDQEEIRRQVLSDIPWRYRIRNIPLPGSKVTADVSKDAPIAPDAANAATVPLVHRDPGPISQPS